MKRDKGKHRTCLTRNKQKWQFRPIVLRQKRRTSKEQQMRQGTGKRLLPGSGVENGAWEGTAEEESPVGVVGMVPPPKELFS